MPDLNSVPPSPRVLATIRQPGAATAFASISGPSPISSSAAAPPSTQMPPPPLPGSPTSIHVFPSNQLAMSQSTAPVPALPSPYYPPLATTALSTGPGQLGDGPGVGPGPGPLRHPRPLTAAELHMQLEKEQEAVVNRLTRELTLLRAQNASVVSNASSTSAGGSDAAAAASQTASDSAHHPLFSSGASGFSIPSSAGRHNRTYSNTSTRSQTNPNATNNADRNTPSVVGITAPAPIRPSAPGLSRQNSTASRRSRTNSPGPAGSLSHSYHSSHMGDVGPGYFPQSPHSFRTSVGVTAGAGGSTPAASDMSPAILPGTTRYEETAFYRAELESVKRENEALRRRIRELERAAAATTAASSSSTSHPHHLHASHHQYQQHQHRDHRRDRRTSDASRGRSESVSTTASMSIVMTPSGSAAAMSTTPVSGSTAATVASTGSVGVGMSTAAGTGPSAGGGGGVGIAGRRESGRERVASILSVAGSVGVGVPEDEVRVGESAASAGLRAQEGAAVTPATPSTTPAAAQGSAP